MSPALPLLERVNRVPGVRGAMVVSLADGLLVEADLMIGVPGAAVAALVASLFERTRRGLGAAELGMVDYLEVQAEQGFVFAVAHPDPGADLLLAAIAEHGVNVGQVRLELSRAVREVGR